MGPTWVLSAPCGPHVGPMNLAIRGNSHKMIYLLWILLFYYSCPPLQQYGLKGSRWVAQSYIVYPMSKLRAQFLLFFCFHDDVIKWKHFPRYWPFVRGIHRSPMSSPHKGQWRGALMFSLIGAWINGRVNNRGAGDLRRHRAHYDATVMSLCNWGLLHYPLSNSTNATVPSTLKNVGNILITDDTSTKILSRKRCALSDGCTLWLAIIFSA